MDPKKRGARLPGSVSWLIKKSLPDFLRHTAVDDYEELYARIKQSENIWKARLWLARQVFSCLGRSFYWGTALLKNSVKIALRNLGRNRGFSVINIAGLSLGMACAILILSWVRDELRYDRFFRDVENLYRVVREVRQPGRSDFSIYTSAELSRVLRDECPGVAASAAINGRPRVMFRSGEKAFYEEGLVQVDPEFFEVLSFPFIAGDPRTALLETNGIVITKEIAKKYFGNQNPLGKILIWNNWADLKVTGVLKSLPGNSHLRFELVINTEGMRRSWPEGLQWKNKIFTTYVKLKRGVDPVDFGVRVTEIIDKAYPRHSDFNDRIYLQPITRVHLHDLGGGGPIKYVYIFSAVAVLILLIACVNYMSLSTARSAVRAKEVGLRKVAGSTRRQLAGQFLGESLALVILAFFFSLVLMRILLPVFNQITGKKVEMNPADPVLIAASLVIVLLTALTAGGYPAFYLSAFDPIRILRGNGDNGRGGVVFRRILVVTQFFLSVGLMICTVFIHRQLNFLCNKELGFDKENIVYIPMKENIGPHYSAIKDRLLQHPAIVSVTAKDRIPTRSFARGLIDWEGKDRDEKLDVEIQWIDLDYFETLNMEILEGRDFGREYSSDVADAVIVNQEAVKRMALESPLGKRISFEGGRSAVIVGVVKNAFFRSRRYEILPEIYRLIPRFNTGEMNLFGVVFIKLGEGELKAGISAIEEMWREVNPDYPFEYHFFDTAVEDFYRNEKKMGILSDSFSFLAILISCMGLFGLASFLTERRTKEIGIRKVLGASVWRIAGGLAGEFVLWILVSVLLAWPAAYLALSFWLSHYAYRIRLAWWVFPLAGIAALAVGLSTIGYQAYKAAVTDPVDALRYE